MYITIQNIFKELINHGYWILTGAIAGSLFGLFFYVSNPQIYEDEIFIFSGSFLNEEYPHSQLIFSLTKNLEFQKSIIESCGIDNISNKELLVATEILRSAVLVKSNSKIRLYTQGEKDTRNFILLNALSNSIINYENILINNKIESIKKSIIIQNNHLDLLIKSIDNKPKKAERIYRLINETASQNLIINNLIINKEYSMSYAVKPKNEPKLISTSLNLCLIRGLFLGILIFYIFGIIYYRLK
jgi:hypothetical protein